MTSLAEIKLSVAELKGKLATLIGATEVKCGAVKTDKAILNYDGEELTSGVEVFVEDEGGNRTPAPDGEYITEDKEKIVVADGKVSEIVEIEETIEETPEVEMAAEETPTEETAVEYATKEDLEAVYAEISALYKAIESLAGNATSAEERLAKVEKMSAGQHPAEAYKDNVSHTTTGDAKLDERLARISRMFKK